MKKLYTLALAAAVAVSASADIQQKLYGTDLAKVPSRAKMTALQKVEATEAFTMVNKFKAAKVSAQSDFYGEYLWSYLCPLGDGTDETGELVISALEGVDSIVGIDGIVSNLTVPAFYTADGSLAIEFAKIASTKLQGKEFDVYTIPTIITAEESVDFVQDPALFTLDQTGNLVMDEMRGFGVGAIDPTTGKIEGFFNLCVFNEFQRYIESDYWTDLGEAEFTDGIVYSMYIGADKAPQTTVKVLAQQSVQEPTTFRLKNPWAQYFEGGYQAEPLYFNTADPELVTVPYQPVGLDDQQDGATYILSICLNFENKAAFLASQVADQRGTLEGDVVTFAPNAVYFNWPDSDAPNKLYFAQGASKTTIVMPEGWQDGVEDVLVSEAGAVEYFNLQGVRVANPEHGVYIRRHGAKATKILVP